MSLYENVSAEVCPLFGLNQAKFIEPKDDMSLANGQPSKLNAANFPHFM